MNNIDRGEGSVDVLAILQEQLESRNKTTVVVEFTVLIILISSPWLVMLSCVLSLTATPSFVYNHADCGISMHRPVNHRDCYAFDSWGRH